MVVKVDENLPSEVADILRNTGHEAVTVCEQGLVGQTDATVAAAVQRRPVTFGSSRTTGFASGLATPFRSATLTRVTPCA